MCQIDFTDGLDETLDIQTLASLAYARHERRAFARHARFSDKWLRARMQDQGQLEQHLHGLT
jgi:hypothetical protein